MVGLFHNNRPLVLILLPFIIAGFVILNLYFPHHLPEETSFGVWGNHTIKYEWITILLAPLIVLINANLLNTTFNRNQFLERNSYIVSLIYVVFMSFFHSFYYLDGFAIAQVFIVLAVQQIFKLQQNEDARKLSFNIAFLFGLAASCYPVFILSLPFLFWIIWVFRPFDFRESLLTITGFTLPMLYARVNYMVFEIELTTDSFSSSSDERFFLDMVVLATVVFTFFMLSLKKLLQKMQIGSIRLRKLYSILIMLIFLSLGLFALEYFVFHKVQALAMVFISLMFILPFAFGSKTPRPSAVFFFYMCLIFAVGKFFIPFIQ